MELKKDEMELERRLRQEELKMRGKSWKKETT